MNDKEDHVRRAAAERLVDLLPVGEIVRNDKDSDVREAAIAKLTGRATPAATAFTEPRKNSTGAESEKP
jgi:hypothetical protein